MLVVLFLNLVKDSALRIEFYFFLFQHHKYNMNCVWKYRHQKPQELFIFRVLIPLSKHLWESNVPLVLCRSIGFLGYIRLQVKEHTIVEAHPDSENPDLRLTDPWPALKAYLDGIDVTKLDQKTRSHIPAVVILYYYLEKYKELHKGTYM